MPQITNLISLKWFSGDNEYPLPEEAYLAGILDPADE